MVEFVFERAVKEQENARIALEGPSGSGKTYSALSIAQGLGQNIAVIDTEKRSARKYASIFSFDTLAMYSYDPRDLPRALSAAAAREYDVVIVDSLSHFWMGKDGLLSQVDRVNRQSKSGNSWSAWKDVTPMEQEMIDALLTYPGHVIVTMRTKTEWVIVEDERGKKTPTKIGTKAIQRDGLEYEFDLVGDLDVSNTFAVSKTRIDTLQPGYVIQRPGPELGQLVREWLDDGVKLPTVRDYLTRLDEATDAEQVRELYREVNGRNLGAAPCTNAAGQSTTLMALITERGAVLGGKPAPTPAPAVAAQPQPRAGKMQRSNGNPPDADPWATEAPATTTPATAPPAEIPAAPEQPPTAAPAAAAEQEPEQPAAQASPQANSALVKAVSSALGKHGVTGDARHAKLTQLVGREITSANDLTVAEARTVLTALANQAQAEASAQAGPPEGWSEEQAEQLCADFVAKIEGVHTEQELVAIAKQIGEAVQAGKLTAEHRDVLLDQHAKAQRVSRGRVRQPVGAPA